MSAESTPIHELADALIAQCVGEPTRKKAMDELACSSTQADRVLTFLKSAGAVQEEARRLALGPHAWDGVRHALKTLPPEKVARELGTFQPGEGVQGRVFVHFMGDSEAARFALELMSRIGAPPGSIKPTSQSGIEVQSAAMDRLIEWFTELDDLMAVVVEDSKPVIASAPPDELEEEIDFYRSDAHTLEDDLESLAEHTLGKLGRKKRTI